MAFNRGVKSKIVQDREAKRHRPCLMCGTICPPPDAAHIIDEREWEASVGCDRQSNGIPLCPNCHRVFDEVLRPRLCKALKEFGTSNLPESWRTSNKRSAREQDPPAGECRHNTPLARKIVDDPPL